MRFLILSHIGLNALENQGLALTDGKSYNLNLTKNREIDVTVVIYQIRHLGTVTHNITIRGRRSQQQVK